MKIEKYQNSLKGIYSITVTWWSTTIYVFLTEQPVFWSNW